HYSRRRWKLLWRRDIWYRSGGYFQDYSVRKLFHSSRLRPQGRCTCARRIRRFQSSPQRRKLGGTKPWQFLWSGDRGWDWSFGPMYTRRKPWGLWRTVRLRTVQLSHVFTFSLTVAERCVCYAYVTPRA